MTENRSRKVLLFPARPGTAPPGGDLLFLFSMGQVEDILKSTAVHPVPFSPPHVAGMARWRDGLVPVLSPEGCLGLVPEERPDTERPARGDTVKPDKTDSDFRFVLVRTAVGQGDDRHPERAMFRAAGPVELLPLPEETVPIPMTDWIPRPDRVRATYAWADRTIVVLDTGRILMDNSN